MSRWRQIGTNLLHFRTEDKTSVWTAGWIRWQLLLRSSCLYGGNIVKLIVKLISRVITLTRFDRFVRLFFFCSELLSFLRRTVFVHTYRFHFMQMNVVVIMWIFRFFKGECYLCSWLAYIKIYFLMNVVASKWDQAHFFNIAFTNMNFCNRKIGMRTISWSDFEH